MAKSKTNPLHQPISNFVAYSWLASILLFAFIAIWSKTINLNELYYYQEFVNNSTPETIMMRRENPVSVQNPNPTLLNNVETPATVSN